MVKEMKIIFAGLENGGKTSIIKTLERKKYIIEDSSPTKGVERCNIKILDCIVTEWDFGGQIEYRNQYLQKKGMFFDTDILYYVIDILDTKKFSEAINYYGKILEILKDQNPKPPIIILFHKCEKTEEIQEDKIQNLQNSISTISNGFEVSFYRTTIYDVPTLLNAFSGGISKISKKLVELSAQLKDIATESFTDALLLVEKNGFILGEYAKDEESQIMAQSIYNYLIASVSYMFENMLHDEKPDRIFIDWERKGHAILDYTELENFKFFLIHYTKNPRKIIQKFVLRSLFTSSKQIKEIITSYFA